MKKGIYYALALLITFVNLSSSQDLPRGIYKLREFQVNSIEDTDYEYPVVATNANNDIYITWAYRGHEINIAKFNSSGDLLIPQEQLRDDPPNDCFYPYICFNENDDYLIAWLDGRNDYPGHVWEIYGVFFNSNDSILLDNFLISDEVTRDVFDENEPYDIGRYTYFIEDFKIKSLPSSQGHFIIPWRDDDEGGDAEDQLCGFLNPYASLDRTYEVMLVDSHGYPESPLPFATGMGDVVVDTRGHLIFTYVDSDVDDQNIYLQRFNEVLNDTGPTRFAVATNEEYQLWPNIAINSINQYYISFWDQSTYDIKIIKYNDSVLNPMQLKTITANSSTQVGVDPSSPYRGLKTLSVFSNDYYIQVWDGKQVGGPSEIDVYDRIYNNNDNPISDEEFLVNDDIDDEAREPSVTISNNDNFIITWVYRDSMFTWGR